MTDTKAAPEEAAVAAAKKEADSEPLMGTDEFVGDVPETAITNAMSHLPGFPARKADGELVDIVRKEATATNTKVKLIAADGSEYQEDENALLVPFVDEAAESKNVSAPYGMTQKSAEKAQADRAKSAA